MAVRKHRTLAPYRQVLLDLRGLLRASDLTKAGITGASRTRLVARGQLVHVARGLYVTPDTDLSPRSGLALAARKVPRGVVCLLSALEFHGLTTQIPHEVWLLIDNKAWRPTGDYPPVRIVYASGESLDAGVATHEIDGTKVRITTPAKTVADCFKYRNKVTLDVAIEALRDYKRKRAGTMDDLWGAAKIDRVARVIRPYLEAVT
jgi:predicted transcriptional regulator of viral defense system